MPCVQNVRSRRHGAGVPAHDWGGKTAWRLFNAATVTLAGKVAEKPDLTKQLHQVIDSVCTVH